MNEQHWGGGSPDEVYEFTPGQFTNNGVCNFNCTWTGCLFDGSISFTNRTLEWRGVWAGPVYIGPVAPGATFGPVPLNPFYSGCGDAAALFLEARNANNAVTSAFTFYCTPCLR